MEKRTRNKKDFKNIEGFKYSSFCFNHIEFSYDINAVVKEGEGILKKSKTIINANYPFSNGLKKILLEKGIKNVFLAEKAGLSQQELSDILNGRRLVKAYEIFIISEILGEKVDDIFKMGKKQWLHRSFDLGGELNE